MRAVKDQGEPVGSGWNWPLLTDTCWKPWSATGARLVSVTASIKAVLSPPALSRPRKAIVCAPAVTVNAAEV